MSHVYDSNTHLPHNLPIMGEKNPIHLTQYVTF